MLKFQAVAEKTAKNFMGLVFCRTLYISLPSGFFCRERFPLPDIFPVWCFAAWFSSTS